MESSIHLRIRELAHDMRSPLQVMEGLVAILEQTNPGSIDADLAEAAKRCVGRLKAVADDLAELSLQNS